MLRDVCVTPDGRKIVFVSSTSVFSIPNPLYSDRLHFWKKVLGHVALNKQVTENKNRGVTGLRMFFSENPKAFNVIGPRILKYLI